MSGSELRKIPMNGTRVFVKNSTSSFIKERIDETLWLQRKHYNIVDKNEHSPQIQQTHWQRYIG